MPETIDDLITPLASQSALVFAFSGDAHPPLGRTKSARSRHVRQSTTNLTGRPIIIIYPFTANHFIFHDCGRRMIA